MKNLLSSERRHREAADRNFSICQKRLDRCLIKVQRLNQEISELQSAQRDIVGMSITEYERWWDEFRSLKKAGQPLSVAGESTAQFEQQQQQGEGGSASTRAQQQGRSHEAKPQTTEPLISQRSSSSYVLASTGKRRIVPNGLKEGDVGQQRTAPGVTYHWAPASKQALAARSTTRLARTSLPGIHKPA